MAPLHSTLLDCGCQDGGGNNMSFLSAAASPKLYQADTPPTRKVPSAAFEALRKQISSGIVLVQKNAHKLRQTAESASDVETEERIRSNLELIKKISGQLEHEMQPMLRREDDMEVYNLMNITYERLVKSLDDTLKRNNKSMEVAATIAQKKRVHAASRLPAGEDEPGWRGMADEEREQLFEAVEVDIDHHENILQEYRAGIRQIESDIHDIGEQMIDLAQGIDEQGQLIDDLVDNVAVAETHVDKGLTALEKAKRLQKKAGKKALILLLVMMCSILVLVAVALVLLFMSGGGAVLIHIFY
ncbi:SNARE domain [Carpediemonas membranifera]|uniref:SNARE domain n=1 Tax=Carpediemonas membranifera TaxID=201153 RepID=A0A8J6E5D8_9EUKA|nr:SNARE domain [Carpediemonas membranifera]|eukprot:KAG9395617.1 SNARE domain [Carpediemonas membranifera]